MLVPRAMLAQRPMLASLVCHFLFHFFLFVQSFKGAVCDIRPVPGSSFTINKRFAHLVLLIVLLVVLLACCLRSPFSSISASWRKVLATSLETTAVESTTSALCFISASLIFFFLSTCPHLLEHFILRSPFGSSRTTRKHGLQD